MSTRRFFRKRPILRGVAIAYVILVLASCLYQTLRPAPALPADMQQATLPRYSADGSSSGTAPLAYREFGTGPALIMLHGNPGDSGDLATLASMLAADYRVIVPDLPGFGQSRSLYPDYGCRAQARTVLALMDQLGIERAAVFGHSMGAGTAWELIDLAPERVTSVVSFGGIGIQEGEGSGDYTMEHIKYAVGMALGNALPELLPHFGLLGERGWRWAILRTFWDTDQRPYRDIIAGATQPVQFLHGRDDPLVFAWVAEEHYELLPTSQLVIFDDSHFMVFSPEGRAKLVAEMRPFLARYAVAGGVPIRRTVDHSPPTPESVLGEEAPVTIGSLVKGRPWRAIGAIVLATFTSEDLTCISVGMLIRRGEVDVFVGVLGCTLGIFVGDMALWLLGYLAAGPFGRTRWGRRWAASNTQRRAQIWFRRHGWKAVVISRFVPGTRFVTYVGAGLLRGDMRRFILWAFIASLLWTPALVIIAAIVGPAILAPFERFFGTGIWSLLAGLAVLMLLIKLGTKVATVEGRASVVATVARLWRHEFWPAWLYYLPLYFYVPLLALRHRGLTLLTLCNPGLPETGLVGESKAGILRLLPPDAVIPWTLIPAGDDPEPRLAALDVTMAEHGWDWPLILKPDAAQRGCGLKKAANREDAAAYLASVTVAVIAQVYHPGPYEAGVFYTRLPGEATGRIFSLTDKEFARLVGDGRRTLRRLIWLHPRFRMQAATFLARLDSRADTVPAKGEIVSLGVAGNHCQGTLFRDGAALITPELEARVDATLGGIEGFHFGRLDLRYSDVDAFRRGDDLHIVELNGCSSESTNMYDPSFSIWQSWGILLRQWALAYRIGAANRDLGHPPVSLRTLLAEVRSYYRQRRFSTLSD